MQRFISLMSCETACLELELKLARLSEGVRAAITPSEEARILYGRAEYVELPLFTAL